MTYIIPIALCSLLGLGWLIMTLPPKKGAALIMNSGPIILIILGAALTILRRGAIGIPLLIIGVSWLRRRQPLRPMSPSGGQKSKVRSAHLEMELDHDTGEMDGIILTGSQEGRSLSSMNVHAIIDLCREFQSDGDTLTLLESYLNRYHPDWQEHTDTESFSDGSDTSANQPMSRQEACQILGVEADASPEEILHAYRNLIKKVHPDSGGSAFLAAKINAAKDVLLG